MEFDKTPRFWYPRVALDAWINCSSHSDETDGSISVDLRDKQIFFFPFSLSLLALTALFFPLCFCSFVFLFDFLSFFFPFYHVFISRSDPFLPQNNLFIFSLIYFNELNSSHFLISKIFVKISSLESLKTYNLETRKKIPIVS